MVPVVTVPVARAYSMPDGPRAVARPVLPPSPMAAKVPQILLVFSGPRGRAVAERCLLTRARGSSSAGHGPVSSIPVPT